MAHSNGPLSQSEADKAMVAMPRLDHSKIPGMDKGAMRVMGMPELNQPPLLPQDTFMEGSMMAMDKGSGQTRDVWVARRLDRICWTHDYTGVSPPHR